MRSINKSINLNTNTIIILSFLVLIFLSSFNSNLETLKPLGWLSLISTLLLSSFLITVHYLKKQKIEKPIFVICVLSILYLLLLLTGLINNFSSRGFVVLFQFATVISFFIFFSNLEWNNYRIKLVRNFSALYIIIIPFIADLTFIAAHLAFGLFFVFLHKKKSVLNLFLIGYSLFFIYQSGARAVLLMLAATLFVFVFWKLISRNKFTYYSFFFMIIFLLFSLVYFYPKLIYWNKFYELNQIVMNLTGQRLMTGRETLWTSIIEIIQDKPLFGYGTGINLPSLIDVNLSAHNYYLQIAFQNGLIGLLLVISILMIVWVIYYKSKTLYATRLSASFLIGILLYLSFEVSLTQNKMDTALMFWLIISVGVSYTLSKKDN